MAQLQLYTLNNCNKGIFIGIPSHKTPDFYEIIQNLNHLGIRHSEINTGIDTFIEKCQGLNGSSSDNQTTFLFKYNQQIKQGLKLNLDILIDDIKILNFKFPYIFYGSIMQDGSCPDVLTFSKFKPGELYTFSRTIPYS